MLSDWARYSDPIPLELNAVQRVRVPAHGTRTVHPTLGPEDLKYWSEVSRGFVQDATQIDLWIDGSSTAELFGSLTVS